MSTSSHAATADIVRARLQKALEKWSVAHAARSAGVVEKTLRRFISEPDRKPRGAFLDKISAWLDSLESGNQSGNSASISLALTRLSVELNRRSIAELARDIGIPDMTLRRYVRNPSSRPRAEFLEAVERWAAAIDYDGTPFPRFKISPELERSAWVTTDRYWTGVMAVFSQMASRVDLAKESPAAERLALLQDMTIRLQIVNRFARRRSIDRPGSVDALSEFGQVQQLNLALFERYAMLVNPFTALEHELRRHVLISRDPQDSLHQLRLSQTISLNLSVDDHPLLGTIWITDTGEIVANIPAELLKPSTAGSVDAEEA